MFGLLVWLATMKLKEMSSQFICSSTQSLHTNVFDSVFDVSYVEATIPDLWLLLKTTRPRVHVVPVHDLWLSMSRRPCLHVAPVPDLWLSMARRPRVHVAPVPDLWLSMARRPRVHVAPVPDLWLSMARRPRVHVAPVVVIEGSP